MHSFIDFTLAITFYITHYTGGCEKNLELKRTKNYNLMEYYNYPMFR